MRKIDGDQSWSKVDFGAGRVIFLDEMEKEDMLQVEYPNRLLLDMGWYQNMYMICIIRDFDWECPIIQYTAADKKQLPDLLAEAVRCAEEMSGNCLSNIWENQETMM
ncbi:MAG: hypothetical protein KHY46_13820 [Clostridiales bacterium]|nr:hypothetical protein [Clostridiales bacterium]